MEHRMESQGGRVDISFKMTRDEIIREPSYTKSSNLGVVQFRHTYDETVLATIAQKAHELRYTMAKKRHLNLTYIRGAHLHIPEIQELVFAPGRLGMLSELAGVELEVYPLSIISSIITFQDADSQGSIIWHTDGIPITEMVSLAIDDLVGGELELYCGSCEVGLARHYERHQQITESETVRLPHRRGYSILGQLMRLMHRVSPITHGSRVTLNMNLRSAKHPYIDDNTMCYLAADNPELEWQQDYIADVRDCQLPLYLDAQGAKMKGERA
jgi:hypothetical protein